MSFVVLPYKNHMPGEECLCVSPAITDMSTHYSIGYHRSPGIDKQVDALIQQTQIARSVTPCHR